MPWLGDGTWVDDFRRARDIVRGKTNYVPWSGDLNTATPRERKTTMGTPAQKKLNDKWNDEVRSRLEGRTIVRAEYAPTDTISEYWRSRPIVFHLDDGSTWWPSTDDEGNEAGALHGRSTDGEYVILPIIGKHWDEDAKTDAEDAL